MHTHTYTHTHLHTHTLTYTHARRSSLVELLLQSLIGIVDAQLLKAVFLEALKAIDIQDAQGGFCLLLSH